MEQQQFQQQPYQQPYHQPFQQQMLYDRANGNYSKNKKKRNDGRGGRAIRAANQATVAVETTTAAAGASKEKTHTGKSNLKNLRSIVGHMAAIVATTVLNANSKLQDIIRMQWNRIQSEEIPRIPTKITCQVLLAS